MKIVPVSSSSVAPSPSSLPSFPSRSLPNPFRSEKRVPSLAETFFLWATGLPFLRILLLFVTLLLTALYMILVSFLLSIVNAFGYTVASPLYIRLFVMFLYPVHFACRLVLWCFGMWYIRTESVTLSSAAPSSFPHLASSSPVTSSAAWLSLPPSFFTVVPSYRLDKRAPILTSTHHTILDAFYIGWICIPTPVAKASLINVPLLGRAFHSLQPILVPRTADERSRLPSVLDQIHTKVQQFFELNNQRTFFRSSVLSPIIIFPEGTTAACRTVLLFQRGAFTPGVPVQPIILSYGDRKVSAETTPDESSISSTFYRLLFRTFYTPMKVTYLPVYVPSTEEIQNPSLYANNVRQLIANITDRTCVPVSDRDGLLYTKCRLHAQQRLVHRYKEEQVQVWQREGDNSTERIALHYPEWVYRNISLPLGTRECEQLLQLSLRLTTVVQMFSRIYESIYLTNVKRRDGRTIEGWTADNLRCTIPDDHPTLPVAIERMDEESWTNLFEISLGPWIRKATVALAKRDTVDTHPRHADNPDSLPWYITSSVHRYAHRSSTELAHTPRSREERILSKTYTHQLYATVVKIITELREYYAPILEYTLRNEGTNDSVPVSSSSMVIVDIVMLYAFLRHTNVDSFNDILHRIRSPHSLGQQSEPVPADSDKSTMNNPLDTKYLSTDTKTFPRTTEEDALAPILTETETVTKAIQPSSLNDSRSTLDNLPFINTSYASLASSASSLSSVSSHPKSISMSGFGTSLIDSHGTNYGSSSSSSTKDKRTKKKIEEEDDNDDDNEAVLNLSYSVGYRSSNSNEPFPCGNVSTMVTTSRLSTPSGTIDDMGAFSSSVSNAASSSEEIPPLPPDRKDPNISSERWQFLRGQLLGSLCSYSDSNAVSVKDLEIFLTIDHDIRQKKEENFDPASSEIALTNIVNTFTSLASLSSTGMSSNDTILQIPRDTFVEYIVKNNRTDLIDTGIRILDYVWITSPRDSAETF